MQSIDNIIYYRHQLPKFYTRKHLSLIHLINQKTGQLGPRNNQFINYYWVPVCQNAEELNKWIEENLNKINIIHI